MNEGKKIRVVIYVGPDRSPPTQEEVQAMYENGDFHENTSGLFTDIQAVPISSLEVEYFVNVIP